MSTDNSNIDDRGLALRDHEQVALAAGYLALMNANIVVAPDLAAAEVRDAFRAELAAGPLGPPAADGLLRMETSREVFEDVLQAADDTPRCLALLVDLCASQPFADIERVLDSRTRTRTLGAVAISLGGDVDEDDVERFDAWLMEAEEASRSKALKWVLIGLGGVAGVATAGLAAPVIGAAIGGAMGLSGAAAASAGLAAVGGGSLAAGGLGMAGGTAIIMATGGGLGLGLGKLVGSTITPERIEVEAIKLFALVRALDYYAGRSLRHADRYKQLAAQGRLSMRELRTSLEQAAAGADNDGAVERHLQISDAEAVVRRLARRLDA